MEDCWDQDAEARLTAQCAEERLYELTLLSTHTAAHNHRYTQYHEHTQYHDYTRYLWYCVTVNAQCKTERQEVLISCLPVCHSGICLMASGLLTVAPPPPSLRIFMWAWSEISREMTTRHHLSRRLRMGQKAARRTGTPSTTNGSRRR